MLLQCKLYRGYTAMFNMQNESLKTQVHALKLKTSLPAGGTAGNLEVPRPPEGKEVWINYRI